jgi:hypothetical protein
MIRALLLKRSNISIRRLERKVEILDAEIVNIKTLEKRKRIIYGNPVAGISGNSKLKLDTSTLGGFQTALAHGLTSRRRKRERRCSEEITTCNHSETTPCFEKLF